MLALLLLGVLLLGVLLMGWPAAAQGEVTPTLRVLLRASPGAPFVAMAASGGAVYVCDARGVVHVSLQGGPFRANAALIGTPATGDGEAAPEPEADAALTASDPFLLQEVYGYVGENVYLDYDVNVQFRHSVGDLFAFPYGTTGEAYLEFTPDSPAFWDAPWFTSISRPDVYFPDPTLSARWSANASRVVRGQLEELGDVAIAVDAADPRVATLSGAFGRLVTQDAGASWLPDEGERDDAEVDEHEVEDSDEVEGGAADLAVAIDGARRFTLRADALLVEQDDIDVEGLRARLPLLARARAKEPPAELVVRTALARVVPPLDDGPGLAPFAPRVDLVGGGRLIDNTAVLDAVFLDATAAGDGNFVRQTAEAVTENGSDAAFRRRMPTSNGYVGLVLTWDLPSLFTPASGPTERAERAALHHDVAEQVRAALERRGGIVEDLVLRTPVDDQDLLSAALDLEQANAHLLALSGVAFPSIGGAAGRALARLPARGTPQQAIDGALAHLGLAHHGLEELRAAQAGSAALPTVLLGASALETRLDEDDYLDEIGAALPWVTKSGLAHVGELRARLTWDLPRTLRAHGQHAAARTALARRDLSLEAVARWSAARRAAAFGDALDAEEQSALLTGLTGTTSITDGGTR